MERAKRARFETGHKKRTRFPKHGGAQDPRSLQDHSMTAKILEDHTVYDRTQHRTLRLKKILTPTDFSPASKNALNYAFHFAEEFGGELILLNVVEPLPTTSYMAIPGATPFFEGDFATAEKNCDRLSARFTMERSNVLTGRCGWGSLLMRSSRQRRR